jgi:hypothetical protein
MTGAKRRPAATCEDGGCGARGGSPLPRLGTGEVYQELCWALVKTSGLSGLCGALILLGALGAPAEEKRLSRSAEYQKYIDPLLHVKEFGFHYYDDGAADATVLFPQSDTNPWQRPRDPVVALVRLGPKSFPLLIDCLGDGRLTTVEFDGNTTTRPMKVPVGYVCLDSAAICLSCCPAAARNTIRTSL